MSTLWLSTDSLILASRSTVRQDMLRAVGIPFAARDSGIDERALESGFSHLDPAAIAEQLAIAKAQAVSKNHPDRYVLGADQTLALGTMRLSKPKHRDAAGEHLRLMSANTHQLHAGFALVRGGLIRASGVQTAQLTMRDLSEDFIDAYLEAAGENILSSVGAYQIEKLGLHLFAHIAGDHFTIMGLPLLDVLEALRREGLIAS